LTNPRSAVVRNASRLATRAFRHEHRRFLAEGAQAVREALAGASVGEVKVHDLFVDASVDRHAELLGAAASLGIDVHVCSERVMAELSDTVTPQGIVAVADFIDRPLASVINGGTSLVALLAEVRDPGNAGSVLRAADAAGADGAVFSSSSVDVYNPKVVRASVGGLFHVPTAIELPVAEVVAAAKSAGMRVFAADGSGSVNLDDLEREGRLPQPTAWLFGNEAWGLSEETLALADEVVRIPIYGRAESLNLATAATLCLYASARAHRKS
jgi:RNA methyltransferase, TrmH family